MMRKNLKSKFWCEFKYRSFQPQFLFQEGWVADIDYHVICIYVGAGGVVGTIYGFVARVGHIRGTRRAVIVKTALLPDLQCNLIRDHAMRP